MSSLRPFRKLAAVAAVGAMLLTACGGDERQLTGFVRDPMPRVGDFEFPDLTNGGAPFALRAEPGNLLVIYFGYTNCPDFCPTTLSDLQIAQNRLAEDDPEAPGRIAEAMISVDPGRDLPVLADYVTTFFEDGHALGTDDPALLARAAAPFGVGYDVIPADESESGAIEVAHSTSLYAVDDAGNLVLTWQFGIPIDDLTADLRQLLDQVA